MKKSLAKINSVNQPTNTQIRHMSDDNRSGKGEEEMVFGGAPKTWKDALKQQKVCGIQCTLTFETIIGEILFR